MKKKKFEQVTAQTKYEKDEVKNVNADVDKSMAVDTVDRKKMLGNIQDRLNYELMGMMQGNDTFLHFMRSFFRYAFEWGELNGLEFWQVGVDGKESWLSHDGKTIMIKPCRTEGNPNPMTGETKSKSGLILPGGG